MVTDREMRYRLKHYIESSIDNYKEVYGLIFSENINPTPEDVEKDTYLLKFSINNSNKIKLIYSLIFGDKNEKGKFRSWNNIRYRK